MKKERLPTRWLALHQGDMIVSKVPLHRMERYREVASDKGYALRFEPSEFGYYVICERSPHNQRGVA